MQEQTMDQDAPTSRTRRRVVRSIVAGSAIAVGLIAANTSIAQASTTTNAGAQANMVQSTDDDPPPLCAFNPLCQPFQIIYGG